MPCIRIFRSLRKRRKRTVNKSVGVWVILGIALLLTGGVALSGVSPTIKKIANAIATAEGFFVKGSLPQQYHNPGDLTKDLNGKGIGTGSQGLIMYPDDESGWEALYMQVQYFFSEDKWGNGEYTISQIAQTYAGDWINWASNVAAELGVTTDTRLNQIS